MIYAQLILKLRQLKQHSIWPKNDSLKNKFPLKVDPELSKWI